MHINELINPADLERGINDKLINVRESGDGQRIYNYGDAALYTPGAWDNPAVRQCRGLITDNAGHIVARPWAKFFNHGQAEAGDLDLDAAVEVTDKLDGSLGIIHRTPGGEVRVATRGSFLSDQAVHATDWLRNSRFSLANLDTYTPLVEIIYPTNRIVCDYGDADELRLIGGVVTETGDYLSPLATADLIGWQGKVTRVFDYSTLREALAAPPRDGAEGLCVRYLNRPHIVKIKQDDYVALHRIVTGLSERTVWQHLMDAKPITDLLGPLPDELHTWVLDVADELNLEADLILATAEDVHDRIRCTIPAEFTRREYAEATAEHPHLRPWLFNLLDGVDPRPSILKTLKPAGDTRAKTITEATA